MSTNTRASRVEAQHNGNAFEKSIGDSFAGYAKRGTAYLDFMPVPTRMVWKGGSTPTRVQTGTAPFDVYGYAPRAAANPGGEQVQLAVFVGAELKTTKHHETSLAIVHPDTDGSGLEHHQLEALALVARIGGHARIVWDNGGQVGVLEEEGISLAHAIYEQSLESERHGKGKGPRGSRSIQWGSFKVVDYANVGGVICLDWLQIGGREWIKPHSTSTV